MPLNPYDVYETDAAAETDGTKFTFKGGYLILARAGGRNEAYETAIVEKIKGWRDRNPGKEEIPPKDDKRLLMEAYAATVVKGWGSDLCGDGKMPDREGKAMPFAQKNVVQFLTDLPDLYERVVRYVNDSDNYLRKRIEADAKN